VSAVRVIALGAIAASDDGAALRAVRTLSIPAAEVIEAGRPGPGLVDLLDPEVPTVLADVTRAGLAPGTILRLPLATLPEAAVAGAQISSHGFGPAESLRLARALGRRLPPGTFVGIEGERFAPGETLSGAVGAALGRYAAAIEAAVAALAPGATPAPGNRPLNSTGSEPCTNRESSAS
jgi:hydrogenase maturation protease